LCTVLDMSSIRAITVGAPGFEQLRREAAAEDFEFIERTVREWESGDNRFDRPGEGFFGVFEGDELVAVAGLNRDPFVDDSGVGRIRRVYVRAAWRGRGIATELVASLIEKSRAHFHRVRLHAISPDAARIYERLGFVPCSEDGVTHDLLL